MDITDIAFKLNSVSLKYFVVVSILPHEANILLELLCL